MNGNSYESTSGGDLKMDAVVAKLQKLKSIEDRLDNLFKAMSNMEDTVAVLDKEVHNLKEEVNNTNKTVKELEDSVDFNDGEIANLKCDLRASQKSIEDLSRQLLYQEHYSSRENLMFMGIAKRKVMDGQGTQEEPENTKELVYKFMEEEMQILNSRDSVEFQRIHRVGKPKHNGPRPMIVRFLRYADRKIVLYQARKTLKIKTTVCLKMLPKNSISLESRRAKSLKKLRIEAVMYSFLLK